MNRTQNASAGDTPRVISIINNGTSEVTVNAKDGQMEDILMVVVTKDERIESLDAQLKLLDLGCQIRVVYVPASTMPRVASSSVNTVVSTMSSRDE